jgi:F0F1-type ATP synthase alpha subunit
MKFDVTEISSLIKRNRALSSQLEVSQVGTVLEVGDGIARLYGLETRWSVVSSLRAALSARCLT